MSLGYLTQNPWGHYYATKQSIISCWGFYLRARLPLSACTVSLDQNKCLRVMIKAVSSFTHSGLPFLPPWWRWVLLVEQTMSSLYILKAKLSSLSQNGNFGSRYSTFPWGEAARRMLSRDQFVLQTKATTTQKQKRDCLQVPGQIMLQSRRLWCSLDQSTAAAGKGGTRWYTHTQPQTPKRMHTQIHMRAHTCYMLNTDILLVTPSSRHPCYLIAGRNA